MDLTSLIGIFFGIVCILIGQALEGGNIGQLLQITAAFIVFGGTIGAVILSFSIEELKNAIILLKDVFFGEKINFDEVIAEIIKFATKARREGAIALEKEARTASDSLMVMGLEAVADGTDPALVRQMMETQISLLEEKVNGGAKVWESAGGFSPTIGIIGAVLGLIQVMQNLSDPSKLGEGIAVAFVATIYGLMAANLYMLPCFNRIKVIYGHVFLAKNVIIEGVLAIQAGESPTLISRKLNSFILGAKAKSEEKGGN